MGSAYSANNIAGLANMLLDAGNKIPPMRIRDAKVQNARRPALDPMPA